MAEKSKNPAVLSSEATLKRAGFYTRILREFLKNRYAVIGLLCLVAIVLLSVFASGVTSYDPLARNAEELVCAFLAAKHEWRAGHR